MLSLSEHATHWSTAAEYLEVFYRDLLPPTADHESSMLQDLRAGRPTEVDALCGAVAKLGAELGVETPVNRALTQLVHAAERDST
jgi:2-dehydropantoate 2-reductase